MIPRTHTPNFVYFMLQVLHIVAFSDLLFKLINLKKVLFKTLNGNFNRRKVSNIRIH